MNAAAGSKLEENLELSNICHHHPAGCVSIPDTCLGNCLGKPNASRDELLKLKSSLIFFDASKFTRHETSSYVNPTKRPLVILDDRLYQMKLYGDEILYLQPFHSRDVEWHDGVPVVKELIDKSAKYASKVANLFKSRGNGNVELQFMEIGKAPKSQMLYRSIHEGNERRGGIADSILIKSTKQTEPLSRNGEIGRRVRRSATNKKQTLESYIRDYYDLEKCVPKCHSQTYHSFANLKDCKKFWMCSHERPLATDVSPGTMFHFDVHQTGAWDEAKCKNMIKVANIVCSTSKSYSEKRIKRRVPKQLVMNGASNLMKVTLSTEDGKEVRSRSKRSVQHFAENDGSSSAYNPLSLAILQFYDWDTCDTNLQEQEWSY